MNSLKEFILSFLETAKERLKNPVIGTFVLSWIAVNWRFVSVLFFSKKTIEQRIDYIECHYFDINFNLWIPLAVAIFYVLILPYLMALFDSLSRYAISTRKGIFQKQKIKDIQFKQEIAAEEWQLEKIRQGSPDIKSLKEKISELERQLEENKNQLKDSNLETEENGSKGDTTQDKNRRKPRKRITTKNTATKAENDENTKSKEISEYPVMKDIVLRDIAKTEREWILIFALYSSDFGNNVFTREHILTKYDESNRKTVSRINNLSNNIKNMVKAGQIKYINDNDMLLTEQGKEIANEILNR